MGKFEDFTDSDLMILLQQAKELRDGKYIKAIRCELDRRVREQ